jgi:hypothetical protein
LCFICLGFFGHWIIGCWSFALNIFIYNYSLWNRNLGFFFQKFSSTFLV